MCSIGEPESCLSKDKACCFLLALFVCNHFGKHKISPLQHEKCFLERAEVLEENSLINSKNLIEHIRTAEMLCTGTGIELNMASG